MVKDPITGLVRQAVLFQLSRLSLQWTFYTFGRFRNAIRDVQLHRLLCVHGLTERKKAMAKAYKRLRRERTERRLTVGALGFFILSQPSDRPARGAIQNTLCRKLRNSPIATPAMAAKTISSRSNHVSLKNTRVIIVNTNSAKMTSGMYRTQVTISAQGFFSYRRGSA